MQWHLLRAALINGVPFMDVGVFSERCLMLLAAFGGSIGMWGGMYFFRHKTKHPKFYIGVPAILIIQIIIVVLMMMKIYHVW